MAIGILTSGTFDVGVAERLINLRDRLDIETISVSVNLGSADPPSYAKATGCDPGAFSQVCSFVSTLTENKFPVKCFAIEHPVCSTAIVLLCHTGLPNYFSPLARRISQSVKRKVRAAKKLSASLGAIEFLSLPYYPSTLYDVLGLEHGDQVRWPALFSMVHSFTFSIADCVHVKSSTEEIKGAFRTLSLQLHPDRAVGASDEEIRELKTRYDEVTAA